MKLTDLKAMRLPESLKLEDCKEATVDALLNLTWRRVSGAGADGEVVFGVKPSLRFVSGFLLPRFEETGQRDETSDIHISSQGLDLQIAKEARGELIINVEFSFYVRALPTWDELTSPNHDLFPNHIPRQDIDLSVRDEMKRRLDAALASDSSGSSDGRSRRRELQQAIYRELLAQHGISLSTDSSIVDSGDAADEAESAAEPESNDDTDAPTSRLVPQKGHYIFTRDDAAQQIDVPQKWQRISAVLPNFKAELSDEPALRGSADAWTRQAREAIVNAAITWIQSAEGRNWAYRPTNIRPSHVQSERAWNDFLSTLRTTPPSPKHLVPDLSGITLTIQTDNDLRDTERRNLRVMIENNSNDVRKRLRHRYDHSIHQVRLFLEIPASAHRALKLDRVESSYRFRDFLTYPAIGINCGIEESRIRDRVRLATTWMPRYKQPRIVPTVVKDAPTDFASLGAERFNPAVLRPLVQAYRNWIVQEEQSIDPAAGTADAEQAEIERERFQRDIGCYRREADRIELGIELLEHSFKHFSAQPDNPEAAPYRAWLLLNRAFLDAGKVKGIQGWRLFQLTFILAHIPTLASRMPEYSRPPWFDLEFDEETATLLYFPTGGGKSEAFFGLLVFNLFLDRLRGKLLGVTALIRYPLRLLTLQQAQRLLALLMHAELLRRTSSIEGAPFEIGFWVGNANTPNKADDRRLDPVPNLDDHHTNDENLGLDYAEVNDSFNKTPRCPICSESTGLRRLPGGIENEIRIFCFNRDCEWNHQTGRAPLPFLIIDRDIYAHAPAVLLGVIDKLALIGQHPSTINRVIGMFGFARWIESSTNRLVMPARAKTREGPSLNGCEAVAPAYASGREIFHDPYPSLVIQDEAHLLEESLGTFAGLFETMLEELFVRGSALLGDRVARSPLGLKPARLPKVIAATATVSVPEQQFGSLYQRKHMHFPYPGTSIYRSFYAVPAAPANQGRRGIGGRDPRSPEIEAPWMRIYTAIMTNGRNHTVTTVAVLSAYHLAITEIWQDLLTGTKLPQVVQRLIDALTPSTPLHQFHLDALNACANEDSSFLLTFLDLMRISLTYVTNKKGGDQVIDAFRDEVAKIHRRYGRDSGQFLTRLISGGIDVAEIQEIMRQADGTAAGRDEFPDLTQSLRNIVATSAISHGVDVDKFNAMFFAGMPNDIAEFIQASSRIGRTHVGFSLLIPTPQARRDRYIVETYDVFHRFLERMIAPPAITRWAASAHDRIITSLFQAWLSGWLEQKLFIEEEDKSRALRFETVNDVNRLLNGNELPDAAKDFMEFCVRAIGIPGRGATHLGAAPHRTFYEERIRNLAKKLTDEFRTENSTTLLGNYWENAPVGQKPMMSLRDIDEAGKFIPARTFRSRRSRIADDKTLIAGALRIVRRQKGTVGELDADEED